MEDCKDVEGDYIQSPMKCINMLQYSQSHLEHDSKCLGEKILRGKCKNSGDIMPT